MTKARSSGLQAQESYAHWISRSRPPGLIVPEAFVRGIRHIGYRSSLEALAELVDNAVQAYAERIEVIFGFSEASSVNKPDSIAVVDDGHGMSPSMMRYALMWGGTHRENDRSGLGRFGYGLPCATVSLGRRFTIYSKTPSGALYSLTLDIDLLERGLYVDGAGEISVPPARPDSLPQRLQEAVSARFPEGWRSGTIVLIEKLDRLDWITSTGLGRNALRHFGVVYHKLLGDTVMHVNGDRVRSIDPLFLSPEGLYYALDDDRAQALDPIRFTVEDGLTGRIGEVTLRYAWLPPTFAATDKSRDAIGLNANERFAIMKRYHGIVFSRNGRVIDVQARTPWTTFINNDRYVRIDVEFSASLDEAFGVTTSKQQVTVSPAMWDRLQVAGMPKAIEHLRMKIRTAKAERQSHHALPCERMDRVTSECTSLAPSATLPTKLRSVPDELLDHARALLSNVDYSVALNILLGSIEDRLLRATICGREEYQRLLARWATQLRNHGTARRQ